jgi:hypothetical protein
MNLKQEAQGPHRLLESYWPTSKEFCHRYYLIHVCGPNQPDFYIFDSALCREAFI